MHKNINVISYDKDKIYKLKEMSMNFFPPLSSTV